MLVAENPKLVSKIVIGKSYEGRDLNVLKVNITNWILCSKEDSFSHAEQSQLKHNVTLNEGQKIV